MNLRLYWILFPLVTGGLFSCQSQQKPEPPAIKVIFDTDMGSDCDDAGALALLHTFADANQAEILACVYSSGKVPYGAAVVQAINRYYGRPQIAVGASHADTAGDKKDKMQAEKLARDTAAFGHTLIHNTDATEQTRLNRQVLVAQSDSSVIYITVGHTYGLYELLTSTPDDISTLTGHELVSQKVKRWVALGALGSKNKEGNYSRSWNFYRNGTAPFTEYLMQNWPVDAFFVDAGAKVLTGKSLKATPPGNIVRTAYRDWLWNTGQATLDDQRPSWDLAAVYFAILGSGEFLLPPEAGYMEFDAEKGALWHTEKQEGKRHFLVLQQPGTNETFADYLNERIAQPPGMK